jgi:nucleoid-associated protein YgaU
MRRYSNIATTTDENGRLYKVNSIYPEVPLSEDDFYVITTLGDRYDTLSSQFYKTSEYWWVIAAANTENRDTLAITPGTQLRIPANPETYITRYKSFNNSI